MALLGTGAALEAQRVVPTAYGRAPAGYVSSRIWVPGGYETVRQRVWVAGRTERVWVEPAFEWRIGPCGARVRVQLAAGHWRTIHHPGHYELRPVRVYRPGYWIARGSCSTR
jgi:hypothetical protein